MGTTVILLATFLAGSQIPVQECPTRFGTFETLVKQCIAGTGYTARIPDDILGRPIVYRIASNEHNVDVLQFISQKLFLHCVVNHENKSVEFTNLDQGDEHDPRARIRSSLSNYLSLITPYAHLSSVDRVKKSYDLQDLSADKTLSRADQEKNRMTAILLRLSATSRGQALLEVLRDQSLISRLLTVPWSKMNSVPITQSSRDKLGEIFAGRGVETGDLLDEKWAKPDEIAVQKQYDELSFRNPIAEMVRLGTPIAYVSHTIHWESGQAVVALNIYNQTGSFTLESISFPIMSAPIKPASVVFDGSERRFLPQMPFRGKSPLTTNALASVIGVTNLNHVSWFHKNRILGLQLTETTLKDIATTAGATFDIQMERKNNWLFLSSSANPYPMTSADWRPFEKLNNILVSKTLTQEKALEFLKSLEYGQLSQLEQVGTEFELLNDQYRSMTIFARLTKAVLLQLKIAGEQGFETSIAHLEPEANAAAMQFIESNIVWKYWIYLTHPRNNSAWQQAILKAKTETIEGKKILNVSLQIPIGDSPEKIEYKALLDG